MAEEPEMMASDQALMPWQVLAAEVGLALMSASLVGSALSVDAT